MKKTIKNICLNAIGIALFVVLTMCVQVPVFENYYICLGYVVMALYCYVFGPVSGTLVGCVGTGVYCLLTGGINGMPGWMIGNLVIGIMFGFACKVSYGMENFFRQIFLIIVIIFSTGIGILLVKSSVEVLLYAHPLWLRIVKNLPAFIADIIVLIMSLPICSYLSPIIKKNL